MTPLEMQEEQQSLMRNYKALKSVLGEMLLEQNGDSKDISYYTRKLEECRKLLKVKK